MPGQRQLVPSTSPLRAWTGRELIPLLLSIFLAPPAESQTVSPVHHHFGLTAGVYKVPGFKDGEFWEALFNHPVGICADPAGDKLYVADQNNHRIRVVDLANFNRVTTLCGTEKTGGQDGSLKEATWNAPTRVVWVGKDRLAVYDLGNARVRLVDLAAGKVLSLTGKKNRTTQGDVFPAEELGLGGHVDLLHLPSLGALAISHTNSGTLWKVDLKTRLASPLLANHPDLPRPGPIALHDGKLMVSGETGTVLSWDMDPQKPVNFLPAASLPDAADLASSGGTLYGVRAKGVRLARLLPGSSTLAPYTLLGLEPDPETQLGTGIPFGGFPGELAADPREERRFFLSEPHHHVIYNLSDRRAGEIPKSDQTNAQGLRDYEYPLKKPLGVKRILLVGHSHLFYTTVPGNLRWGTVSKMLELQFALQASLRGSRTKVEVLTLAHAAGDDFEYTLWPYFEVPRIVEKFDIDQVLYIGVPQIHTPFMPYLNRPMGKDGIPSETKDPEYFLRPFSEKELDPVAERVWKRAVEKNFARLNPQGQPQVQEAHYLLEDPELMRDMVELVVRTFGPLGRKLSTLRNSKGEKVGFHLCFAPLPTKNPDTYREFWTRIAKSSGIPLIDLSGPIRALRPTMGEVTDGGHEHFHVQGHAFLAQILAHEILQRGFLKF